VLGKKKQKKNEKVVLFLNGLENCSYHTRYCLYCDPLLCIKTRYCSAQSFALTVPVTVICESDRSFQVARLLYYSIDYYSDPIIYMRCLTHLPEPAASMFSFFSPCKCKIILLDLDRRWRAAAVAPPCQSVATATFGLGSLLLSEDQVVNSLYKFGPILNNSWAWSRVEIWKL